jgi:Rod binding domain-containing protein
MQVPFRPSLWSISSLVMDSAKITSKNVSIDPSHLMEMVHSKNKTDEEKTKFVTEQFESVLVKQFLNDALKPMFKGVFNENSEGHRLYRHFFTDALSESIAQGGGFGVSSILQQQLTSNQGGKSLEAENKGHNQ